MTDVLLVCSHLKDHGHLNHFSRKHNLVISVALKKKPKYSWFFKDVMTPKIKGQQGAFIL